MEIIFATLIGLIAGVLIGNLIARNRRQTLLTQTEVLKAQVENEKTQAQAILAAQEVRHQESMAALQTRFDETLKTMRMQVQTATDNAQELIDDLSLEYNKRRQQAITAELADIVSSSEE